MSDENDKAHVGATVTNVNGKGTSTIWLRGDDIGAPGSTYPDGSAPTSQLGCVKAGTNIVIAADGTISASGTIGTDWSAVSNKPFKTIGTGLTVDGAGALNVTGGGGSVAWADITGKPSTFAPPIATASVLGGVKQGTNITIAADGTISASGSLGTDWSNITNKPTAFPPTPANGSTTLGGVKAGTNITIAADGTISATGGGPSGPVDWKDIVNKPATFTPPIATSTVLGGVKPGTGLSIDADGTLTRIPSAWNEVTGKPAVFPVAVATKSALGGVIAGAGVNIDANGTISVNSAAPAWNDITGKPATFTPPIASAKLLGGVKEGAGINIEADGTINTVQAAPYWDEVLDKPATFPVAIATKNSLGGVIAGPGVSITEAGEISVRTTPPDWSEITDKPTEYNPPIASTTVLGGVKQGNNISIDPDGTINAAAIDLPIASSFLLGGVKIGPGITVQEDGTIGTEEAQPEWASIIDKPLAYPPTNASDGVVGGIMPDDNFEVSASGLLSAKPFVGRSFAVVQYDDSGKIIPSYTMENRNGNLVLGGVQPTVNEDGSAGEDVSFGGAVTLIDKSGKYRSTISNDSFDYNIVLTNGPNVRKGFLPFVTNVVGETLDLAWGALSDAIGYATSKALGVVQVGGNIDVDSKGVISVKTADKSNLGLMIAGDHLNVNKGVVTPAIATDATPGIVQVGTGLEIDANGVLSTTSAVGFLNRITFTNNTYDKKEYDWTLPEGVKYFRVTVVGGGGTGGGMSANANEGSGGAGGGGGGGCRAIFYGYKFTAGDLFKVGVGCSNYGGNGDGKESYFRKADKTQSYLYGEGGKGGESGYVQGGQKKGATKPGAGGRGDLGAFDSSLMCCYDTQAGGDGSPGMSVNTPQGAKTCGGAGGGSMLGSAGGGYKYSGAGAGGGGTGEMQGNGAPGGMGGVPGIVIIEW